MMGYALAIIFNLLPDLTPTAGIFRQAEQNRTPQPSQAVLRLELDLEGRRIADFDLDGPFLIRVNDSFFRKPVKYPGVPERETIANDMFLFVDVDILNNSNRSLQIPSFTLRDSQGRSYVPAARSRLFSKIIRRGDELTPGARKSG